MTTVFPPGLAEQTRGVQASPRMIAASEAVAVLGRRAGLMAATIQSAADSDADVVVVLARRAYVTYRLLQLAGLVKIPEGRVVNQRAIERDPTAVRGQCVAIVDDIIRKGSVIRKYAAFLSASGAGRLTAYASTTAGHLPITAHGLSVAELHLQDRVQHDDAYAYDFADRAVRAFAYAGMSYFVDFPEFEITDDQTIINDLFGALVGRGWIVSPTALRQDPQSCEAATPRTYSSVGFVLSEPNDAPDAMRLRVRMLLDSEGQIARTTLLVKVSDLHDRQRDCIKTEVDFRDRLFLHALTRFRTLLQGMGALSYLLNLRADYATVLDSWPASTRASAISALEDVCFLTTPAPVYERASRCFMEPTHEVTTYRPLADEIFEILQSSASADYHDNLAERTGYLETSLLRVSSAASIQEVRCALDILHDQGAALPRVVTLADGTVGRVWTSGEGIPGDIHSLPLPHASGEVMSLNPDLLDVDLIAPSEGLRAAIKRREVIPFLASDGLVVPVDLLDEDSNPIRGLALALKSLPRRISGDRDAYRWLKRPRPHLGGSSYLEALIAGRERFVASEASKVWG